jgi:hypothetical protein
MFLMVVAVDLSGRRAVSDPTIITSLDGDQNFGAPVALTEDDALRLTRTMPDLPESFAWNMKPFIPRW